MGEENPVDKVYFYRKSDHNRPTKISSHEVGLIKVIITCMSYNLTIKYILIFNIVGNFILLYKPHEQSLKF